MQTLARISVYALVLIIILAVVAVLFSFLWVFLPLPRWLSSAMGRLLIRFWRWRARRRRRSKGRSPRGLFLAPGRILASCVAPRRHKR
jgi:hypothetical protein